MLPKVDLDEIHHITEPQAVDEVADCPAEDKRQGTSLPAIRVVHFFKPPHNNAGNYHRDTRKQPPLPAASIIEQTERCAGVVQECPIKAW